MAKYAYTPLKGERAEHFLCDGLNLRWRHDIPKRAIEFCIHDIDGDSSIHESDCKPTFNKKFYYI